MYLVDNQVAIYYQFRWLHCNLCHMNQVAIYSQLGGDLRTIRQRSTHYQVAIYGQTVNSSAPVGAKNVQNSLNIQFANKSFHNCLVVLFCKCLVCVLISQENDLLDSTISDKNIDWGYKHSYPWCQCQSTVPLDNYSNLIGGKLEWYVDVESLQVIQPSVLQLSFISSYWFSEINAFKTSLIVYPSLLFLVGQVVCLSEWELVQQVYGN